MRRSLKKNKEKRRKGGAFPHCAAAEPQNGSLTDRLATVHALALYSLSRNMHPNLRTFLDLLSRENDITTVEVEVDPYLEVAEIHRRVIERGGPALLFKRVKGSRFPVVTNLFGTKKRIELAFGPKPEALVRQLVQVAESLLPPRPAELWRHRSLGREMLKL